MPRLRRLATALVPALLIPALVACGSTKTGYGDPTVSGFDGVTVGGKVGQKPTLTWKSKIAYPSSVDVKTLVSGDGGAVGKDGAYGNLYIGDATTAAKSWVYTSSGAQMAITSSMGPVFQKLLDGAHVGDRRAALARSSDVFGSDGRPDLGVGNHDTVVVVVDLIKAVPDTTPHDVSPSQLPKLELKNGKPSGFDFSGVKKPSANGKLLRAVIKKGTGKTVTSDMTVTANYLGMTYGAKAPFDESYSSKPASFGLSDVVLGWKGGLTGVKVGSRVLLQIPPSLGYGSKANPGQGGKPGIPANSTLYFVIDIVSAKKG
ncbi:FKBP-type peptidyl-prolyl cis-trans isomerase [Nocardioides cheoyonin]|uniref:FKBP-type peptidyl-prolyl cis-trans isomerase n=1 Tax=Nocardioides cheoyonin TaxID=3156615 RepID=UPI0032B5A63B